MILKIVYSSIRTETEKQKWNKNKWLLKKNYKKSCEYFLKATLKANGKNLSHKELLNWKVAR